MMKPPKTNQNVLLFRGSASNARIYPNRSIQDPKKNISRIIAAIKKDQIRLLKGEKFVPGYCHERLDLSYKQNCLFSDSMALCAQA